VESLRPSLDKNAHPDALIGPSDSTAIGWNMLLVSMLVYLVDLRAAAPSAAEPAASAAVATYESANGDTTVTSQVSGYPSFHVVVNAPCVGQSNDEIAFAV